MIFPKLTGCLAAGALVIAVTVGACTSATSSPSSSPTAATPSGPGTGGSGSNARSGPAAGGASGTVAGVSTTGFTLTTAAGQNVAVSQAPSTTYQDGTSPASASAISAGAQVVVLGTVSGTTISASEVIMQPAGAGASTSPSAAGVVPLSPGAAAPSKQVGQIPPSYSQGSGTIVSGTTADQATVAALAAYPGGIINRVVQLSDGTYEAHNIGVNWPHHIFVNQNFKVVGAN